MVGTTGVGRFQITAAHGEHGAAAISADEKTRIEVIILFHAAVVGACALFPQGAGGGKGAIIDLKSSSVVQNVLALIQLNGYDKLATENGICDVGALFILHLGKEKKYELICVEIDDTLFMGCLALHNALQKKKKKKENE